MQASHQNMRFLYRNGLILESCHICMDSLIISLHGNVNNSKFIKKNIPLNFDHHPPPLKHNDVAARKRGGGVNIVLKFFQPNHFNEYLL